MKNPRAPLIGFVSQFGLMPFMAWAIAKMLGKRSGEERSDELTRHVYEIPTSVFRNSVRNIAVAANPPLYLT